MIINFLNKETETIFNGRTSKKLPADIQKRAYRKLLSIDSANSVEDLKSPPSNNLEKLSSNRIGQYSIRINNQWRSCFKWENNNALSVEIVDYH